MSQERGRGKLTEDPLLGRQLGNYRLVERIGQGAYGEVYRAEHIRLGISYAAKVLHPTFMQQKTALKRFWREAQTTGRLKHKNIVSVSDFDVDPLVGPYLIMEFLEGQTLGQLMKREGALPLERVREIARSICKALGAAHHAGVIHRDLKPDNIFLAIQAQQEVLKILDFGIARLTEGGESLTGVGQTLGTPEYMSPEQCRGLPLSASSDIYCFGVLLFQMLSGILPFEGEDAHQVMVHHLIAPVPLLGASFAPDLREYLSSIMAKRPEDRPADMEEVWRRLSRLLPRAKTDTSPGETGLTLEYFDGLANVQPVEEMLVESPAHETDDFVVIKPAASGLSAMDMLSTNESPVVMMPPPVSLPAAPASGAASAENGVILLVHKKDDSTPTQVMEAASGEDSLEDSFDDSTAIDGFHSSLARADAAPLGREPVADLGTFEQGLLASLDSSASLSSDINVRDIVVDVRRLTTLIFVVPGSALFLAAFGEDLRSGLGFFPTEEPLGEGESFQFQFEDPSGHILAAGQAEVLSVIWPGERTLAGMSASIARLTFAPER